MQVLIKTSAAESEVDDSESEMRDLKDSCKSLKRNVCGLFLLRRMALCAVFVQQSHQTEVRLRERRYQTFCKRQMSNSYSINSPLGVKVLNEHFGLDQF